MEVGRATPNVRKCVQVCCVVKERRWFAMALKPNQDSYRNCRGWRWPLLGGAQFEMYEKQLAGRPGTSKHAAR
jgi:hypothetical protein